MKTLLTNARLINPETGTDALGWLLIDGANIAAMGEANTPTPTDRPDQTIDCNGKMPCPRHRRYRRESLRTRRAPQGKLSLRWSRRRRWRCHHHRHPPPRHRTRHRHARNA